MILNLGRRNVIIRFDSTWKEKKKNKKIEMACQFFLGKL